MNICVFYMYIHLLHFIRCSIYKTRQLSHIVLCRISEWHTEHTSSIVPLQNISQVQTGYLWDDKTITCTKQVLLKHQTTAMI